MTAERYYLDLLLEELPGGGVQFALPANDEAWEAAIDAHADLMVPCDLSDLTPPITLVIEVAVISREHCNLAIDLIPVIEREAQSLFRLHHHNCYQMDDDGRRLHWIWGRATVGKCEAPVCSKCGWATRPESMKSHEATCWKGGA